MVLAPFPIVDAAALRQTDRLFYPVEHKLDAAARGYEPALDVTGPSRDVGNAEWFVGVDQSPADTVAYFMANVLVDTGGKAAAEARWREKAPFALNMISNLSGGSKKAQARQWNNWVRDFNTKAAAKFGATNSPQFELFNEEGTALVSVGPAPPRPKTRAEQIREISADVDSLSRQIVDFEDKLSVILDTITKEDTPEFLDLNDIIGDLITLPPAPSLGDDLQNLLQGIEDVQTHAARIAGRLTDFEDKYQGHDDDLDPIIAALESLSP